MREDPEAADLVEAGASAAGVVSAGLRLGRGKRIQPSVLRGRQFWPVFVQREQRFIRQPGIVQFFAKLFFVRWDALKQQQLWTFGIVREFGPC